MCSAKHEVAEERLSFDLTPPSTSGLPCSASKALKHPPATISQMQPPAACVTAQKLVGLDGRSRSRGLDLSRSRNREVSTYRAAFEWILQVYEVNVCTPAWTSTPARRGHAKRHK